MSKAKKHGVKRGTGESGTFAQRQAARKKAWTRNVYVYTQQETMDAASLVLHEIYGFGPERLKRFGEAFKAKFQEIQELDMSDSDDPDRVYSREKFENAMQEAWGQYYEPRELRYYWEDYVLESPNKPVIYQ